MKLIIPFLAPFFISFLAGGQARTVTGKVVDLFEFKPIPSVFVYSSDTIKLGTADRGGSFKLELPAGTDGLLFGFVGMEWVSIKIPNDCNNLEIIMTPAATYDFMTMRKVNRLRYRVFKDLQNKHHQAYEQGVFTSSVPCFTYIFRESPSR